MHRHRPQLPRRLRIAVPGQRARLARRGVALLDPARHGGLGRCVEKGKEVLVNRVQPKLAVYHRVEDRHGARGRVDSNDVAGLQGEAVF